MSLEDLAAFVQVARHGGITGASKALGLPKSTVSRRVTRLEAELGAALLHRKGRSVVITDSGKALADRAGPALLEIERAQRALSVSGEEPSGTVKVTAPRDFASTAPFAAMVGSFTRRFPAVSVDMLLTDRVVDLIGEGVDVAIRAQGGDITVGPGLRMRRLRGIHAGLFASPAYLAEYGEPTLATLSTHRSLLHPSAAQLVSHLLGDESPFTPTVTANDFGVLMTLCVQGEGITMIPLAAASSEVAAGRLVRVMVDLPLPPGRMSILWPETRYVAPRVRAFLDHAIAWAQSDSAPVP